MSSWRSAATTTGPGYVSLMYDEFWPGKNEMVHEVAVYRMTVTTERAEWPEKNQRRREWVPAAEAIERIEEDELREIVAKMVAPPTLEG